jgi:hypothetical protein
MVKHKPEDEPAHDGAAPGSETEVLMRALHRASLSLYTDLSLDGVLRRITQAAKDLAGARAGQSPYGCQRSGRPDCPDPG